MTPNRVLRTLLRATLLAVPLGYGAVLLWQEWAWRGALPGMENLVPPLAPVPDERTAFKPDAIASVLGLVAQETLVRSTEVLVLRASFVSEAGDSRALMAGAEGERIYRIGDVLPGGSMLSRIDVGQVSLWRNGREELLPIEPSGMRLLLPVENGSAPVLDTNALLYFQQSADSSQSD